MPSSQCDSQFEYAQSAQGSFAGSSHVPSLAQVQLSLQVRLLPTIAVPCKKINHDFEGGSGIFNESAGIEGIAVAGLLLQELFEGCNTYQNTRRFLPISDVLTTV